VGLTASDQDTRAIPKGKPDPLKKWLTIQLGSREHYAIPRVLQQQGQLSLLLTDSWVRPNCQPLVGKFSRSLALRHHLDLPDHKVRAPTLRRVAFDVSLRARKVAKWDGMFQRNQWFQRWSARQVLNQAQPAEVCFSYSYGARLPFHAAKSRGMSCVLGQIDPGPLEQEIVDAMTSRYDALKLDEAAPPQAYWDEWKEELELADQIVVNSAWSNELLIRQGVPAAKIRIIPLAYEGVPTGSPQEFRSAGKVPAQPLTVLFLGQVILRKGVGQLFDAIRLLNGAPIRFVFAGPLGIKVPADIGSNSAVQLLGPVNRQQAIGLYSSSDVFILPTLSDGFALTQLEAMAHGLPAIASRFCGEVVTDGLNGHLLHEVSPEAIADILLRLIEEPTLLELWRRNCRVDEKFSLTRLATALRELA
jgi:glycosyltransferase involved in cell wall biosynthesis